MLYTKDGYPQINEIVLCTVNKIYGNTTFVKLNEYEKEAVLIISEIAPGRIRNLREYVVENKEIICKVLRVDAKKDRIDVSLRRVPIIVMKKKLEEIKKEEYAERMYLDISKQLKISKDELFEKTYEPIFENYETVFEALYTIMLDNKKIEMFKKLDDSQKEILINIVNDRIKPEEIIYKKIFHLKTFDKDGINLVKSAITSSLETLKSEKVNIIYLAAGEFEIKIIDDDLKSASKIFENFKNNLKEKSKVNKLDLII